MNKFYYLYISQLFSVVGDGFFRISLIFLTLNNGGVKLLAQVFAIQAVIIAITVLFSGILNKYLMPKSIVIISSILRATTCIYMILLISLDLHSNYLYFIIGIIFGMSDSLYRPNYVSILKFNVTLHKYDKQVGLLTSSRQLLNILTPMLAAFVYDSFNNFILLIISTILFLLSAFFSVYLKDFSGQKISISKNILKEMIYEIKKGFIYIFNNNWLKIGMLISILVIPFQQALSNVVVPVFATTLNNNAISYSSILTSYAIGAMLAGLLFGKIGKFVNSIIKAFLVILIAYLVYSFSGLVHSIVTASAISFIVGGLIQIYNISWEKFTIQYVKEEYIGNISSVSWFIFSSFSPIMIALVGYLIDILNVRMVIVIIPLIICVSILIITITFYKKLTLGDLQDEKN
ncbi:MFS transporter [Mammaliicoccus fleurettii]|uniref:MFS transporter n=1 Tax=Mammaliicoccus fleurettii TaxID=150056 RepID=UPI002DB87BF7|nr:MFS transporter [Mammaliicoccus fleurettii]MEB7725122.1 MFS transporter [Mammaliicoccus fleurettii]